MKAATLWPVAVAGVLAVTVVANAALLVLARDPRATAVEPDYYRKAVAWDSTRVEEDRSAELGWSVAADLARRRDGDADLAVRVLDRAGRAIDGATVRVVAIHNLEPERRPAASLTALGSGAYRATLPLRLAGRWELRFEVTKGADRFETSVRRDLR